MGSPTLASMPPSVRYQAPAASSATPAVSSPAPTHTPTLGTPHRIGWNTTAAPSSTRESEKKVSKNDLGYSDHMQLSFLDETVIRSISEIFFVHIGNKKLKTPNMEKAVHTCIKKHVHEIQSIPEDRYDRAVEILQACVWAYAASKGSVIDIERDQMIPKLIERVRTYRKPEKQQGSCIIL